MASSSPAKQGRYESNSKPTSFRLAYQGRRNSSWNKQNLCLTQTERSYELGKLNLVANTARHVERSEWNHNRQRVTRSKKLGNKHEQINDQKQTKQANTQTNKTEKEKEKYFWKMSQSHPPQSQIHFTCPLPFSQTRPKGVFFCASSKAFHFLRKRPPC